MKYGIYSLDSQLGIELAGKVGLFEKALAMAAALKAVRPLIRNQVLEEAAKICQAHMILPNNPFEEGVHHGARRCRESIRNLKDKI